MEIFLRYLYQITGGLIRSSMSFKTTDIMGIERTLLNMAFKGMKDEYKKSEDKKKFVKSLANIIENADIFGEHVYSYEYSAGWDLGIFWRSPNGRFSIANSMFAQGIARLLFEIYNGDVVYEDKFLDIKEV